MCIILIHDKTTVLYKIIRYDNLSDTPSFHNETILAFFLWGSGQCGGKLQIDGKN